MEATIGLIGKDFVLLAADGTTGRGLIYKNDFNKIYHLQGNRIMSIVGKGADRQYLSDFISRNISLNYYRNSIQQSTYSISHWISKYIHEQLRKEPKECHLIIGGVENEPKLYFVDYYGNFLEEKYTVLGNCHYLGYYSLYQSSKLKHQKFLYYRSQV